MISVVGNGAAAGTVLGHCTWLSWESGRYKLRLSRLQKKKKKQLRGVGKAIDVRHPSPVRRQHSCALEHEMKLESTLHTTSFETTRGFL